MVENLRIFLVRHGQSLGNLSREIYSTLPDHKIPLSRRGEEQAQAAGQFLKGWLQKSPPAARLRLWYSPYERTRATAAAIVAGLGVRPDGLVHDVRPNLHLIEQRFGLFDGLWEDEMEARYPREYVYYRRTADHEGRFWATMPGGDSPYDVAMRVHQAFGTFHRDLRAGNRDLVIVSHGVTIRAFLMMWLQHDVDWYEVEPNPNNCSVRLIEGNPRDGYEDHGYLFEGFAKEPEVQRHEDTRGRG